MVAAPISTSHACPERECTMAAGISHRRRWTGQLWTVSRTTLLISSRPSTPTSVCCGSRSPTSLTRTATSRSRFATLATAGRRRSTRSRRSSRCGTTMRQLTSSTITSITNRGILNLRMAASSRIRLRAASSRRLAPAGTRRRIMTSEARSRSVLRRGVENRHVATRSLPRLR